MKNRKWLSVTCGLLVLCFALGICAGSPSWKTFKGAWFEIKYPTNFKATPREMRVANGVKEFDGASFTSPDGQVEFYVYSPQWSGTPKWVTLRQGEKQVSWNMEKGQDREFIYVTLKGPNNKYTRSYVRVSSLLENTNWYFGFQYRNQTAYKKYHAQYLTFKKSLKQFAD